MIAATEIPWEALGAGGAALLVAFLFVFSTNKNSERDKDTHTLVRDVTKQFGESLDKNTKVVGDCTAILASLKDKTEDVCERVDDIPARTADEFQRRKLG